jgi:hypothetical protein
MAAGFFLSITAIVLYSAPTPRAGFVLSGVAVQCLGLFVAMRAHMETRGEDR